MVVVVVVVVVVEACVDERTRLCRVRCKRAIDAKEWPSVCFFMGPTDWSATLPPGIPVKRFEKS